MAKKLFKNPFFICGLVLLAGILAFSALFGLLSANTPQGVMKKIEKAVQAQDMLMLEGICDTEGTNVVIQSFMVDKFAQTMGEAVSPYSKKLMYSIENIKDTQGNTALPSGIENAADVKIVTWCLVAKNASGEYQQLSSLETYSQYLIKQEGKWVLSELCKPMQGGL